MKKLHILLVLVLLTLSATRIVAQQGPYTYDKEKVYLQTDHVFFAPGETIFYKIYLVRGSDNKPSGLSNIVYVEIYGPSGALQEKQTWQTENGYAEGSYTPGAEAPGGIYRLKAYTSWMRNEKDSVFFTRTFTVQKIIAPRVLMTLDLEKKGYGPGDQVRADFSMRSLDNAPVKGYNGQFTVTLDGQTYNTGEFMTDDRGKAKVLFTLPQDLNTNDGLLNLTVDYDAYTESIARSIPITLNKVDLQFLPEGGSLVAGLQTNIAFKAIDEQGKPVDVSGVIRDEQDRQVASFDSYKFGMGKFLFTPETGRVYTASITTPANIRQTYPIPAAVPEGVVMNMSESAGIVTVTCRATSATAVRLVGRTKDITYYSADLQLTKGSNEITVPEDRFPAGIAQFTLYARSQPPHDDPGPPDDRRPLAERLIFLSANKQLRVTLSPDKALYLPREKVRMTLTTTDENGKPIPSNFSLSVVDDKLWTLADDRQDHILSWLLMSSELHGPIEEPPFYFKKDEQKAAGALDLVMLTNGYRYFDLTDDVLRNRELQFSPDESAIVSGVVTDDKDRPIPATVYLINNSTTGKAWKEHTGIDGQFYFSSLTPKAAYLLIAQSIHGPEQIKIRLGQNGIGHNPLRDQAILRLHTEDPFTAIVRTVDKLPAPLPALPKPNKVNLLIKFGEQPKALQEVVVVGYGTVYKRDVTGSLISINASELRAVAPTIATALEGKVAGIYITPLANAGAAPVIQLRGAKSLGIGNEPLIVVDGVPQAKYDLVNITVNDIASVTVLKDAEAVALYGARAANGVILIQSTKPGYGKLHFEITRKSRYTTQLFNMNDPAFSTARRFYAPHYRSTLTDERNDYRQTIYWNPVVQTDRNGKATVEFYNSDASTSFRAIAEGIGYNGRIGRADTTYAARAAMSVDAKIPPYLTVGDQALIPVVIKNNGAEPLDASVALTVPPNMHTGGFRQNVSPAPGDSGHTLTLDPGASRELLVPLTATAPADGTVYIHVTSNLADETIELPVTAAGKGFPVIETFSGNADGTRALHIGQVIPGSLHAKLNLYRDLAGQLTDDIASMLREPHGCFEQTSSTTYPNIFILKYLRQTGRSNPVIERRAMSYITEGYKRLIGYETAEHGFEWFGHTPAHIALTAYGLLEFTDMQEFVNVDKNMLKRTKDFLLSRRDGKGGFKPSARGYDELAEVPASVANTYVVYAMTQAGYGDEIKPEYAAAVNKALESDDAYQLAMMALAASNTRNSSDYRLLMDRLQRSRLQDRLTSETSVVNSHGVSLRIETQALYALALMRDERPDMGVAADLISRILAGKSYYGYGSTQGTLLALQAVTEYGRLAGEMARNGDIHVIVNGRSVTPDDSIAALLHTGQNTLAVEYPGKGRGIPFNLEVGYQTLTPPNSEAAPLRLRTNLSDTLPAVRQTVRMTITVTNDKDSLQPMAIARIGIPAGLSLQPWQLKELTDRKQVAYYEIFDNYLVLYWMGFAPRQTRTIALDLKAEIPGTYKARASNVYLYYTPEYKYWEEGVQVGVR